MPRNGISISWLRKLSYLKKLMRNLPYLESIFRCLHLLHSKQYHNSTPNTVNLVAIQNLTNYKIYNLEYRSCEIKKSERIFKLKYFVENWLQHHKPWWIFVLISLNLKPFKDLQKKSLNFWEHFVIIKMHNNKMFKHLKSINFVINISGLTKLINNLLILEYIKLKSHHPTWKKLHIDMWKVFHYKNLYPFLLI